MIDLTKVAANVRAAEALRALLEDACKEQREICAALFVDKSISDRILFTQPPEFKTSPKSGIVKGQMVFDSIIAK